MGRDRRPNVVVAVWITQLLACMCWWLGTEVLFRASQKLMFCVPGIFGAHLCVSSVIQGLGTQVSLKCHLVVSDVDPGNEHFIMCKRAGAKIRNGKVFLRSSESY